MPRKTPGSLRQPPRPPDDINRFVRDNVAKPDQALASMRASTPTPEPERIQPEDLLARSTRGLRAEFDQDPVGVTEVCGPAYRGPVTTLYHSHAGSPAPAVGGEPQPYTPVGRPSAKVVFQAVGAPVPAAAAPPAATK